MVQERLPHSKLLRVEGLKHDSSYRAPLQGITVMIRLCVFKRAQTSPLSEVRGLFETEVSATT